MNDSTRASASEASLEYRIEGYSHCGWILFDRVSDERNANLFYHKWQEARKELPFRLVKVTTTISREVIEEDKSERRK